MRFAASLAAAVDWSRRSARIGVALLALLSLSAPALAAEQVYIWRDQSGALRFSTVAEPVDRADSCTADAAAACERDAEPVAVVVEANAQPSR